jgi:hypothetical protein
LKDDLHVGNSVLLEVNESNVVSNIREFLVGDKKLDPRNNEKCEEEDIRCDLEVFNSIWSGLLF